VLAASLLAPLTLYVASSLAKQAAAVDLPAATPSSPTLIPLVRGTTYRARLVTPTPTVKPAVRGWIGAEFVSHKHNAVRHETGWLSWQNKRPCGPAGCSGQEVDIVAGPAMTETPAALIARVRNKDWNFDPYDPPGSVQMWSLARRSALYFDATVPPGSPEWALVGVNPPDLKVARDHAFRMSAMRVRGKTVEHSDHVRFVQQRWLPEVSEFLELDYAAR